VGRDDQLIGKTMSTFLVKSPFHYTLANNLIDDVRMGRSSYYYFLGKVLPWDVSDEPPVTIENTLSSELDIRNEIIAMEKITGNDVSLVIPRIDWEFGQVYDMWDSTIDMIGKRFYVITDTFDVYKCIDNNNNATSTVKPFGNSISMVTTPDGYVWKYMYTVPLVKRKKFESVAHIPVQRSMADSNYDSGSITSVIIQSRGTGYLDVPRVSLNVIGGNPTTLAELVPVVSETSGEIVSVYIRNSGDGFTSVPTISVISDDGTGTGKWNPTAVIRPIVQGGKIVRVTIDDPGIGYPAGGSTYIEIDGDGEGAAVTPVVIDGEIKDVVIENRGSGYTFMTLNVVGQGTGVELTAFIGNNDITTEQSLVESTSIDGGIHAIKLTEIGSDYTSATISIIGDGSGATAIPILQNGQFVGITVTNPGTGYTNARVVIAGNNISNNPAATSAEAYPILSPVGGHGKDPTRELFADTVCFHSIIRYSTESVANISQDFRQYGILKNPSKMYTGNNVTEQFALTTYTATLSGTFGIVKDDVLKNGDSLYRVIDIFPGNVCVILPLNTKNLLVGDILTTTNTVNSYTVNTISAIPLANKYSGEMLFTSADYAFAFNASQSVTIKTYMKL
jgi:hypothetical protein